MELQHEIYLDSVNHKATIGLTDAEGAAVYACKQHYQFPRPARIDGADVPARSVHDMFLQVQTLNDDANILVHLPVKVVFEECIEIQVLEDQTAGCFADMSGGEDNEWPSD
ncbi:hypothetical protein GX51_03723 [Blastomyces parvus]|uniref:Uncharacterized protein n=1 Tax=Blastomyces parvus TaxID=2060905 RepID=A0A2B7X5J0_9EURO|nr:hypothetical protein GX51_03723 [Blastomyces parvus]